MLLPLLSSQALAYDDPAVAVCEYSRFQGADIETAGRKRTKVHLNTGEVRIAYDFAPLNTEPVTEELVCKFKVDVSGEIVFDREIPAAAETCIFLADRVQKSGQQPGDLEKLQQCMVILQESADLENKFLKQVTLPLIMMGLYPIKPDRTKLQVVKSEPEIEARCVSARDELAKNPDDAFASAILRQCASAAKN